MILSLASNFYHQYLFLRSSIQRQLNNWNQHRFNDKKWGVTAISFVTPIKHKICKLLYASWCHHIWITYIDKNGIMNHFKQTHGAERGYHYTGVIISEVASQITSLTIVYSAVDSGADQRKHQSPPSLAFVRGIHRWPLNSPCKGPVTRKMFPFDDVIMWSFIDENVTTWSNIF